MGIGFGRPFEMHSAGSEENFCCFLSNGREGCRDTQAYDARLETLSNPHQKEMLRNGERIKKNPASCERVFSTHCLIILFQQSMFSLNRSHSQSRMKQ